jgi:hypothetical protein
MTESPSLPTTNTMTDDDALSVGSASSTKSEERRRRREHWLREHETQLKVDGTFPRRRSSTSSADHSAVSAKVVSGHWGTKTTAKLHTLPPAVSDSVRVRSNLLRTLGIQKKPPAAIADDSNAEGDTKGETAGRRHRRIQSADGRSLLPDNAILSPSNKTPPNRSLLSNVRMKEELKYDSDDDADANSNSNQSSTSNNYARFFGLNKSNNNNNNTEPNPNLKQIPRRRRLLFSENVEVVPIPMRSEYSNRIKERMYSNRIELSENAQRNVVEFEAEGWDAATVLDDENQFYKCPLTGELIHPVHLSYFTKSAEGEER